MLKLFEAVLMASFWGGCITLLLLLINKLFKTKLPASWHYYIWMAVLVRLLVPVTFELSFEASDDGLSAAAKLPANIERFIQSQEDNLGFKETVRVTPSATEHIPSDYTARASDFSIPKFSIPMFFSSAFSIPASFMETIAYLWFGTAFVLLVHRVLSYNLYMRRLKKHSTSLTRSIPVQILKTGGIHSPFATGLRKPVIVLPAVDYSESQLNYIFAHELNHLKRRDIAVKWLFEIAKCVHWFNPLVYVASNEADFYCDASCDEDVLKNSDQEVRREYGMILIDIISQAVNVKAPVSVTMSKSNLKKRIDGILNPGAGRKNIFLKTLIIFVILSLCACSSISYKIKEKTEAIKNGAESVDSKPLIDINFPSLFSAPGKTNFLVAGTDQDGMLTDVIMVGAFDKDTKKLRLISVPRDTRVELTEKTVSELGEKGIKPSSNVVKINSLNLYGGKNGMKFLQSEVEQLLDIKIDYYAKIDLDAFRKIVDAVGGIEMDLRQQGYYYYDPVQNLRIEVPGGRQILNGKMAEGVIRFRSDYREGDVERIRIQHEFMKQFFTQVLNKDAIMNNLTDFISVAISDVDTNFGVGDIPKYAKYAKDLSSMNMQMDMLPGEGRYIGEASYFVPEQGAVKELADNIWGAENSSREPDITELKIQVLNGNGVPGMAAKARERLAGEGLNVIDIGDYDGSIEEATRVFARDKNTAKKFTSYFKNAKALKDSDIPQDYDVVIVVGKSEV